MNMNPPKVLVVGAGPSGLCLALTLLQNGVAVRIIDKRATYAGGQRGAGIMPRTLEAYNILGILPDVMQVAFKWPPMQFYELPGGTKPVKTAIMMPDYPATPAVPFPIAVGLGQVMQEQILRSHLEKYSCRVELQTELQAFKQHSDHVTVSLVHHTDGESSVSETAEFEYVVGTDGAHSTIRKLLGAEFAGETREGDNVVIADIQVKSGLSEEVWHSWGTPRDRQVTIRSAYQGDGVFVVLMLGVKLDRNRASSSREELIKEIYDVTGRTDIEFGDLGFLSQYRPNIRMVSDLRYDRVFLAGDAAHCHSPTGGQGMNSGFQDAFNLGWKLALVLKGHAHSTLLDSYNEERIPVIAEMLFKTTAILDATFKAEDSSGRQWFRGGDLRMLGVNYRKSSIVVDDHPLQAEFHATYDSESATAARAGDRAPDAPGLHHPNSPDAQTCLFDIFRCYQHTILVFSDNTKRHADILTACKERPTGSIYSCLIVPSGTSIEASANEEFDSTLCDQEGHAFSNYHVPKAQPKVFVIRPDGVIGAAADGVEGLRTYFSKVFAN